MDYLAFILSLFFCALVSSDGNIKENEPAESVTLSDVMNGILNVRIDVLSLKDKINSNMNAIEKVQQAIHNVQVDVVFLKDRVNDNNKAITENKKDITENKKGITENNKDINGFGGVVSFSEGGHVAKKYYNDYKISFIGYGYRAHFDDSVAKSGVSFSQCLEYCHTVREERGTTWDDIEYRLPNKYCYCAQRGWGHIIDQGSLHYHFF